MSDLYDDASDAEALHREMAIAEIRNRKAINFSGHCLYCNDSISQGRFCSAECHEDWELAQKYAKIAGKK